jgi:genome maintenance exonuclease 1
MILTNPYNYKEYGRETLPNGIRHYDVGEARSLPSVTTILGETADKSFLVKWRESIGEEEANKIVKQAVTIGNQLHDNLEQYVLTGAKAKGNMLTRILTDLVIKRGLCNVDEVWGTEVALYSSELYAGTTDLVGIHKGEPAIMDFKNSRKYKQRAWVEDYFCQLAAYGESHNQTFGTSIRKGVVMMGCHTGHYLEFVIEGEEYDSYVTKWYERLYTYYEKFGL